MKTPLIIIDMQPFFGSSKRPLKAVLKQIDLAKEAGNPIILVEYDGCGPSYTEILTRLVGYKDTIRVLKNRDGGGGEIIREAETHGIDVSQKVRVVGVNRSYCVFQTVIGMKNLNREINGNELEVEIPTVATWCTNPVNGRENLKRIGCRLVRA